MTAPLVAELRPKIPLFALRLDEPEFALADSFLDAYKNKPVAWGPVGWVTYKRTYSRYQDPTRRGAAHRTVALGEMEEWYQTVARVVEGSYRIQQRHCAYNHLHFRLDKAQDSAQRMFDDIFNFRFLPPGRGLWMMGTEFIETHGAAALNNCGFVSTADIAQNGFSDPFCTLMDLSMLGVGVGFDTDGAGLMSISKPEVGSDTHIVPDTREGWIDACRRVLDAHVGQATLPKRWDYSHIRPAGARIRGFGGTAAGPAPLERLLEKHLPEVLGRNWGKALTSTTIVDVSNVIGKCVVSGNVRRSAEIAFGYPGDMDFLDLKNPDVAPEGALAGPDSYRWSSNNSLYATVGMDYTAPASRTAINGEPGYLWIDNARRYGRLIDPPNNADIRAKGANPCAEQSLESYELCCLVETFPAYHDSYEEYERTLKAAYLYAKSVTLVPTHLQKVNAVLMRNRRIGTSQSGIVESFQRIGRREHLMWCDQGYRYLRSLDDYYSEWLAVPKSIKVTSIKPSGSVSKLCGATSGMHRAPARFYIQRIRFAETDPLLPLLQKAGYYSEPDVNGTGAYVVDFPVEQKNFEQAENDVPAAVQMGDAVALQRYWADNQVSCTIKFNAVTEGPHIKDLLEQNEDQLKGISFLPYWPSTEVDEEGIPVVPYAQAPWQPISERKYREMVAQLRPIEDVSGNTHTVTTRGCDSDMCIVF